MPEVIACEKKTFARSEAFDFHSEMKKRNIELVVFVDTDHSNAKDVCVVAYIVLSFSKPGSHVFLHKICVQPGYRGQGIATQKLREITKGLKSRGCSKLQLWVKENNTLALKLYHKLGFEQVSHVRNYYGSGQNGLQMRLDVLDKVVL